jgi:hypothetical protein
LAGKTALGKASSFIRETVEEKGFTGTCFGGNFPRTSVKQSGQVESALEWRVSTSEIQTV